MASWISRAFASSTERISTKSSTAASRNPSRLVKPDFTRSNRLLFGDRERTAQSLGCLRDFLFDRVRGGCVAIDIDFPAGQPRCQARVLALLPDRERKLIFIHRNLDALFLRIEDEVLHLRGLERLEHKFLGSELQRMMSTFSLFSSRTMFFTRDPRMPTQAPTGSTFSFALVTAIFVR